MYETIYDNLEACFGQENLHLLYMDTDSFVSKINTKDIIEDLKHLAGIFDFSNLDENHELFNIRNEKVIGKFKNETPKINWIDGFVCLRSIMYAFKCGDDSKKKLEGLSKSQSKKIKIEEQKKCLNGKNYQGECETYILRSVNHEMYLQQIEKSTLSIFDDKRCFINEIESKPWN